VQPVRLEAEDGVSPAAFLTPWPNPILNSCDPSGHLQPTAGTHLEQGQLPQPNSTSPSPLDPTAATCCGRNRGKILKNLDSDLEQDIARTSKKGGH